MPRLAGGCLRGAKRGGPRRAGGLRGGKQTGELGEADEHTGPRRNPTHHRAASTPVTAAPRPLLPSEPAPCARPGHRNASPPAQTKPNQPPLGFTQLHKPTREQPHTSATPMHKRRLRPPRSDPGGPRGSCPVCISSRISATRPALHAAGTAPVQASTTTLTPPKPGSNPRKHTREDL